MKVYLLFLPILFICGQSISMGLFCHQYDDGTVGVGQYNMTYIEYNSIDELNSESKSRHSCPGFPNIKSSCKSLISRIGLNVPKNCKLKGTVTETYRCQVGQGRYDPKKRSKNYDNIIFDKKITLSFDLNRNKKSGRRVNLLNKNDEDLVRDYPLRVYLSTPFDDSKINRLQELRLSLMAGNLNMENPSQGSGGATAGDYKNMLMYIDFKKDLAVECFHSSHRKY